MDQGKPKEKNLIQKAAAVMAQVEHVPKNGHNSFHNYDYATEADITSCVRAAMAEQGLMLIPTVEKVEWSKLQRKNGEDRLATMTVKFTLTDGNESKEFIILGEGADAGDKATYKAMTGALKYALLKLFMIPTGDDPEKEAGDVQRPPVQRQAQATPRQQPQTAPPDNARVVRVKRIMADAKSKGIDRETRLSALVTLALGTNKGNAKWSDEDMAFIEGILASPEKVAEVIRSDDVPY